MLSFHEMPFYSGRLDQAANLGNVTPRNDLYRGKRGDRQIRSGLAYVATGPKISGMFYYKSEICYAKQRRERTDH